MEGKTEIWTRIEIRKEAQDRLEWKDRRMDSNRRQDGSTD